MEEMLLALDLPPDTPPTTKVKDLQNGRFSVNALRERLSQRTSR